MHCVCCVVELYNGETPNLMQKRWGKLVKDFQLSSGRFDISKIPDIYDCIKYDLLHNRYVHYYYIHIQ